jgi:hypothetical protein
VTHEHRIMVNDDGQRKPVEADDAVKEGPGHRRGCIGVTEGDEVRVLGEAVNHVRMTDLPPTLGRPSMKSMEISAHTCEGTSSGCSIPVGHSVSILFCWHVTHDCTQSRTSAPSPGM